MNRRALLHAGVGLSCALAGCLDGIDPLSASSNDPPCPDTVPVIERADFDGTFRMRCNTADDSTTAAGETTLVPATRRLSLPDAATTVSLVNNRDEAYNANFYNWRILKHVDGQWYSAVARRFSPADESSLAPQESHTWSLSVSNDGLERPVAPVTSDEQLPVRALGPGRYAFVVVGSYGRHGQSMTDNQPFIGYAATFTLAGDDLELVPTNRVRSADRDGETVTVTVGSNDPDRAVTVSRRSSAQASNDALVTEHITETVYGNPLLRDVLAQFEPGVERVTVRTHGMLGTQLHPGATFAYGGETYEVTELGTM